MKIQVQESKLWSDDIVTNSESDDYKKRTAKLKDELTYYKECVIVYDGSKESEMFRHLLPNATMIYCVTGVELPHIINLIKSVFNTDKDILISPSNSFGTVLSQQGYPVINSAVSQSINNIRTSTLASVRDKELKNLNPLYKPLLKAPFPISGKCCIANRKEPYQRWATENKRLVLLPTYLHSKFGIKTIDTLSYLWSNSISISEEYKNTTHFDCAFCLYNILADKQKLVKLKQQYPEIHQFLHTSLGFDKVWEFLKALYGIKY